MLQEQVVLFWHDSFALLAQLLYERVFTRDRLDVVLVELRDCVG